MTESKKLLIDYARCGSTSVWGVLQALCRSGLFNSDPVGNGIANWRKMLSR